LKLLAVVQLHCWLALPVVCLPAAYGPQLMDPFTESSKETLPMAKRHPENYGSSLVRWPNTVPGPEAVRHLVSIAPK
jgi:hypothetical protein